MNIPKVDDLPRQQTMFTSMQFRDLILQNHRLTIREIAEDVDISFGSCQAILTEKLNMHCVTTKFVTCVLTEDQKANCVNISQKLLDRVSVNKNFLKTNVTGDESLGLRL